ASRSALEDDSARARPSERNDDSADNRDTGASDGESDAPGDTPHAGAAAGRLAGMQAAHMTPFAAYTQLEYETARDALAPLARRFRVRVARRLRRGNRGRIDFRGTIRASMQRGGAMFDLRWRMRRPAYVDLLLLADVSGSVRYASELMLEIAAGARASFRSVRSFVFVDRIAEVEFEDGRVVTATPLDLYARSDFARVFAEVRERRIELLGSATLVIVMGDGRNNRRPARADHLREIARASRAVVWLNPEPRERWGSGDSAIFQYEKEVTAVLECTNLTELRLALDRSVAVAL
ncbi:MAG TPA: VWA domain-containing protein, partial [Candidatus Binataceae bacterium]|nr:VWA domain-containing protein [Candidatus Binataceae bacterium]